MSLFRERPELLKSFLEGRRETLEEVYRTYRASIDSYLRVLWIGALFNDGPAFAIADLRQEIFIRAFSPRARAAYDANRRYAPYLMKIARNCFIDEARSRRREAMLFDTSVQPWGPGDADWDPSDAWDPQVVATVRRYLADLPPKLRAVYDQRYVSGETQEIACAALGLSRRSLRTAEEHLKHGLRKALARRELGARFFRADTFLRPQGTCNEARSANRFR